MKSMFASAVFGTYTGPRITAYFTDGRPAATYTASLLPLLAEDPLVADIIDADTGEILYTRYPD